MHSQTSGHDVFTFEMLYEDYSALYIEDALAHFVAKHDNPDALARKIEKIAEGIEMPFS